MYAGECGIRTQLLRSRILRRGFEVSVVYGSEELRGGALRRLSILAWFSNTALGMADQWIAMHQFESPAGRHINSTMWIEVEHCLVKYAAPGQHGDRY